MTVPETLLRLVLARLQATTPAPLIPARASGTPNVRRVHRIPVSGDNAPEVQLVDGGDNVRTDNTSNRTQCLPRTVDFTVAVLVRADDGYAAADPLLEEIFRRLDPATAPYPYNGDTSARLSVRDVRKDPEIADGDALRVDIGFRFSYDTSGFGLSA